MKICKTCIIPESFPNVTFENGKCVYCKNHEISPRIKQNNLGKKKLLQIIKSDRSNKYDCVVPLSGGKDSTFVLFYLARELKLNPLAVHFDSGFTTNTAIENVKKVCKKLQTDLVIGRASNFREKLVKQALYTSKHLGEFISICDNCENNLRTFVINESIRQKIPMVVWGSTDFEDDQQAFLDLKSSTFRKRFGTSKSMFLHMLTSIFRPMLISSSFKNKCKAIFHNFKHIIYLTLDNIVMNAPEGWKNFYPFLQVSFNGKKVRTIYFYDYISYDPYKQIEFLSEQFGYETPKGEEAKLDCKLHCFGNYCHLQKTGITRDGFYLSTLIRYGLMTRTEAIKKENIMKKKLKKECKTISKELGVEMDI